MLRYGDVSVESRLEVHRFVMELHKVALSCAVICNYSEGGDSNTNLERK